MSPGATSVQLKYPALRDLSPGAQAAAGWFRSLARALKTCRLYRNDNPIVQQIRQKLHEQLNAGLESHGAWRMKITPIEIWLVDEPIVRPSGHAIDELPTKEELLPFAFYRDGIRAMNFSPNIAQRDFDAFFEAMIASGSGPLVHDDLVTLLWQANPQRIQIEAVPVSQTIYLSSSHATRGGYGFGRRGLAFNWSPSGEEIRADIGQLSGLAQGLHLDTFDDWPLPTTFVDVAAAYAVLTKGMQFVRSILLSEWAAERGAEWTQELPDFFRTLFQLDPSPDTRDALAQSIVTWITEAIQRCAWVESQQALTLVREFDPDGSLTRESLTLAISGLDYQEITERLDESEPEEQSRFFALAVALGNPILDLGCAIMANAGKPRTRAAACTMLCYLCSENPDLLAPYLSDSRWFVVRNTVFVLGQIGGVEVVDLLQLAAQHPDPRVRRQVIHSLGNVPPRDRLPILSQQLNTSDLRLLAATLHVLARHRGPETTRLLLHRIQATDFETRDPDFQRMMFNIVSEMADDDAVPVLASMVLKGGWFARPSQQRVSAAQALHRIGSEKALAVLEEGLRTGNEAVKAACLEAMSGRGRP
jgi:hypothetical protein